MFKYNQICRFLACLLKANYKNLKKKIKFINLANFEELHPRFTANNDVVTWSQSFNTEVSQHLSAVEDEFERYFLELNGDKVDLVRDSV